MLLSCWMIVRHVSLAANSLAAAKAAAARVTETAHVRAKPLLSLEDPQTLVLYKDRESEVERKLVLSGGVYR